MLIGLKASKWYYMACTLGPYAILVLGVIAGIFPWTVLTAFIALPKAVSINREVVSLMESELPFSGIDVKTASLQLTFSLLLACGFVLGIILL